MRGPQPGDRLDQDVGPLARHQPSDIHHQRTILREAKAAADGGTFLLRDRHEPLGVHAGRDRRDIEWREVSGKGVVFSYTITHRGTPAFRGAEPYAVVSVTLDVGVNFIANIVNCTAEELKVGLKVKPYWQPLEDGTHLMLFQPDHGGA